MEIKAQSFQTQNTLCSVKSKFSGSSPKQKYSGNMKQFLFDNQKLEIVVKPTNEEQQDNMTTQNLTSKSETCSIKTEAHFDEEGQELVEARDFGIGTEGYEPEDLEALALENLKELDQLGLIYDYGIMPN